MTDREEIRIYAFGTELELRPVSVAEYLESRNNAISYSEKFGGDKEAENAALLAELIFKGAYNGENRVFTSAEDVLNKLTLSELAELGGMLYIGSLAEDMFAEDSGMSEAEQTERGRADKSEMRDELLYSRAADTAQIGDDMMLSAKRRDILDKSYLIQLRKVDSIEADFEKATETKDSARKYYRTEGISMERISDFFQRDSRRYDGYIR